MGIPFPSQTQSSEPQEQPSGQEFNKPASDLSIQEANREIIPLSIYSQDRGLPYTAEKFGIDNYQYLDDILDVDHVRDKIGMIEGYIFDTMKESGLEDKIKSYESVLDSIFSAIGYNENESKDSQFNRVFQYIKLQKEAMDARNKLFKGLLNNSPRKR